MKLLYLIGAIIVFLLILILAMPQIGSVCTWYLINSNTNPTFVIFQSAGLGAVMGGLLVMFWKTPKKGAENEEEGNEEGSNSAV